MLNILVFVSKSYEMTHVRVIQLFPLIPIEDVNRFKN